MALTDLEEMPLHASGARPACWWSIHDASNRRAAAGHTWHVAVVWHERSYKHKSTLWNISMCSDMDFPAKSCPTTEQNHTGMLTKPCHTLCEPHASKTTTCLACSIHGRWVLACSRQWIAKATTKGGIYITYIYWFIYLFISFLFFTSIYIDINTYKQPPFWLQLLGIKFTCNYHEPMQKQVGHRLACSAGGICCVDVDGHANKSETLGLKATVFSERRMRERGECCLSDVIQIRWKLKFIQIYNMQCFCKYLLGSFECNKSITSRTPYKTTLTPLSPSEHAFFWCSYKSPICTADNQLVFKQYFKETWLISRKIPIDCGCPHMHVQTHAVPSWSHEHKLWSVECTTTWQVCQKLCKHI